MSEWQDFPQAFLRRTMMNVESYRGKYEVTNLINNCLGLIVIPNDHLLEMLPKYTFNANDKRFGIMKRNIRYEYKEDYELQNIVQHVRNGLSHGHIEQQSAEGEIVGLRIFDKRNKTSPENFSVVMSIDELKLFAFSLANAFLG